MAAFKIQLAQRGVLTLPKTIRDTYNLKSGDSFTLIDLGGVFVLNPGRSRVDEIADKMAEEWIESGESLESMLRTLREVRQQYE